MKDRLTKVSSKALVTGTIFLGSLTSTFASNPLEWVTQIDSTGEDLDAFIIRVINWGIGFAAIAAVIMLIAAGFLYITANGDENKIGKATKTLTFAIVGLIVCFIAVMLVNFVISDILKTS